VEQFSMERTLEPGELLLVDRVLPNLTGFARGDIVLVRLATSKPGDPPLVKRVIGLPGETLTFRDGAVWIDGRRLAEPYVFDGQQTWPQPGHPSSVVIPAGSVFLLGDHRSSSADSRIFGPVPLDSVIGRVWFEARFDALATLLGF
jgi:signal peptidase I